VIRGVEYGSNRAREGAETTTPMFRQQLKTNARCPSSHTTSSSSAGAWISDSGGFLRPILGSQAWPMNL